MRYGVRQRLWSQHNCLCKALVCLSALLLELFCLLSVYSIVCLLFYYSVSAASSMSCAVIQHFHLYGLLYASHARVRACTYTHTGAVSGPYGYVWDLQPCRHISTLYVTFLSHLEGGAGARPACRFLSLFPISAQRKRWES